MLSSLTDPEEREEKGQQNSAGPDDEDEDDKDRKLYVGPDDGDPPDEPLERRGSAKIRPYSVIRVFSMPQLLAL